MLLTSRTLLLLGLLITPTTAWAIDPIYIFKGLIYRFSHNQMDRTLDAETGEEFLRMKIPVVGDSGQRLIFKIDAKLVSEYFFSPYEMTSMSANCSGIPIGIHNLAADTASTDGDTVDTASTEGSISVSTVVVRRLTPVFYLSLRDEFTTSGLCTELEIVLRGKKAYVYKGQIDVIVGEIF